MRAMTFCEIVLDQLPHITKGERKALREELEGHLEDHAARLEARGVSAQEACARAEEAMGDPVEIGRALAKQYPRFWLWAYRLLSLVLVAGCVLFLIRGPILRLQYYRANMAARTDPWADNSYTYRELIPRDMDFQVELETDILRVYRVGVDPEAMTATVYFVTYDKDPWGIACSEQYDGITITNQAGSDHFSTAYHLAYGDGYGANYGFYMEIPIAAGDDHLTFQYDRFGVRETFLLPLPEWEGEK